MIINAEKKFLKARNLANLEKSLVKAWCRARRDGHTMDTCLEYCPNMSQVQLDKCETAYMEMLFEETANRR